MFQLNISSSDLSMKTYRIQDKRRIKASYRKGMKIPIKDMTSLILMTSLWIQMIAITKTYLTHI